MKRPMPLSALFVLAALLGSGIAHAQSTIPKLDQEGRKGDMARLAKEQAVIKFNAADTDKDGKLSKDEAGRNSPYLAENFDKRDSDEDGFIDWEEYVGHDRWPKDE